MSSTYNPFLLTDFYKVSHVVQYPEATTNVLATWIPRSSYLKGIDHAVAFGFQAFIKEYLVDYFNDNFFNRPKNEVLAEYSRIIRYTLNDSSPKVDHLSALHDLGSLPLHIKALPEGTRVPLRVPMVTIENTHPDFFWLTNAIETLFSAECWQPVTSATIAAQYRDILDDACERTGGDPDLVQFQGHDFSFRGMEGWRAAAASGAGHLLSFAGTDTIPAILYLEEFYGANVEKELVGTSIPATEHSVMSAGIGVGNERETYRRLLAEVYPSGFLSIVSDTVDLWNVMTDIIPSLYDTIMAREGKLVIRPDSGDPVDIVCGTTWDDRTPYATEKTPAERGVYELLWDTFGGTYNGKGFKVLDPHVGCIYGDAITPARAKAIGERLEAKGFCTTSQVLGIGSYTYQYQTRDSLGQALKSTYVEVGGRGYNIFKDPVTDVKKIKKSLTGRVIVSTDEFGEIYVVDGLDRYTQESTAAGGDDLLQTVFLNGRTANFQTLAEIRARVAKR